MKAFLKTAFIAVLFSLSAGCATVNLKDKPEPALPSKSNVVAVWIPANYWSIQGEKNMIAEIDACAANGVGYGIEMAGWSVTSILKDQTKFDEAMRLYKVAVKRCRKKGIWMVVSIANNNSHLAKHGNGPYAYTLTSVWPKLTEMVSTIKSLGPKNQLIQPLAETQTSDGIQFEKYCAGQLAGYRLIYNGNVGRPKSGSYGWPYVAYHQQHIDSPIPKGFMAISDCGSIIQELHGSDTGKGNANLKTWAAKCKKQGAILVGDYAFRYDGAPDVQAMKYMVEGLK